MLPIRTILHPTDFSKSSEFAFRLACALANDYGAKLALLHVAVDSAEPREEAEDKLQRLQQFAPRVQMGRWFAEGDPAAEILRLASEIKADLIVMGTHGRTGAGRLLMGSVAEQTLRKAACPVLTVKSPSP